MPSLLHTFVLLLCSAVVAVRGCYPICYGKKTSGFVPGNVGETSGPRYSIWNRTLFTLNELVFSLFVPLDVLHTKRTVEDLGKQGDAVTMTEQNMSMQKIKA